MQYDYFSLSDSQQHIVGKILYRHKRPCNANTNFRDNRIWKLDHFQSARIVYYHLN